MRRAAKKDLNHNRIVDELRAVGASVAETYQLGSGYPDLTVGWRGRNYLFEVKTKAGKLTPDEMEFFNEWRGQVVIIHTADDALRVMGAI